ncbi:MAG: hypothetical protein M1819_006925 [Sarea resinae]|nr:MAG: hypothetical protein M1819_006925 [Sarea resinae]
MAEVINIAPGIAGLLSLTTEVFNISSDFSNVHRANEAANSLLQELQSLRRVLAQLKELTDKDEEGGLLESNSSLILASEDIGLCRATLKNIQKNLEKHPDTSEQYGRVKSLTWPFSEERTQEITCMLHRHFSLFQSALNADAFPSGTETLNEIRGNQLENSGENHPEGLDWLSRINVRQRHHDISSRRQDGTGRWLLEDIVINDWLEANNSTRVVWCPGDPGTGKTVMTSLLIDYIESKNDTEDVGIAFMYFDFQDPKMQTASEIIASLVHQLAKRTKHLPRDLRDLYGELKDGLGQPQFNPLLAVLKSLCNNFKQTYIILDALDEFGDLGEREILLSSLIPLTQGSLKLLATSRPNHVDLKLQFDNVPQVEIRAPEDDIRNYARERMGADQDFTRQITPSLEEQIINTVAQRASGM